eukprot:gene15695-biopygen11414
MSLNQLMKLIQGHLPGAEGGADDSRALVLFRGHEAAGAKAIR